MACSDGELNSMEKNTNWLESATYLISRAWFKGNDDTDAQWTVIFFTYLQIWSNEAVYEGWFQPLDAQ